MRMVLAILSVGTCLLAFGSIFADRKVEHREDFSFTEEAGSGTRLEVNNTNGRIQVRGISGLSQIRITGTKIVSAQNANDAKSHIGDIKIDVSRNANGLTISSEHPDGGSDRNYTVNYVIEVPQAWKVQASTANGNVEITALRNGASANISNGSLEATDIVGTIEADVTNGAIRGNARIPQNATCNLKTANGIIDATLQVASSAKCNLQATNGKVTLALPSTTSAGVSAFTQIGEISVEDLEFSNRVNSRPNMVGAEFKGTLGAGASSIAVQVNNGQIVLKAADEE